MINQLVAHQQRQRRTNAANSKRGGNQAAQQPPVTLTVTKLLQTQPSNNSRQSFVPQMNQAVTQISTSSIVASPTSVTSQQQQQRVITSQKQSLPRVRQLHPTATQQGHGGGAQMIIASPSVAMQRSTSTSNTTAHTFQIHQAATSQVSIRTPGIQSILSTSGPITFQASSAASPSSQTSLPLNVTSLISTSSSLQQSDAQQQLSTTSSSGDTSTTSSSDVQYKLHSISR